MAKQKNKKVIELMEDELDKTIVIKFVGQKPKTYSKTLTDANSEDKKAKDTKKCVVKIKLKFGNYRNCLEATELKNQINHLENK